jgi:hypothetical protein
MVFLEHFLELECLIFFSDYYYMSYQQKYLKYKKKYLDNKNISKFGGNQCWGWHLSLDAKGANDNVKNKDIILKFGKDLIKEIKMEAHNEPQLEYFGKDDKKGWTYSQLITTSNICCHYCDDGNIFLDVFSCKIFDSDIVKKMVEKIYEPTEIKIRFFTRGF